MPFGDTSPTIGLKFKIAADLRYTFVSNKAHNQPFKIQCYENFNY